MVKLAYNASNPHTLQRSFKESQMTKETWDNIITTASIAIISYTIGYFVGGGV
jgi:hypothetical protein